jgi:phosphoenolpyruvate carboxykinase (GTP)
LFSFVSKENISQLSPKVKSFVEEKARVCQPNNIHICDGSENENRYLLDIMQKQGMIEPLNKYENWYEF